MKLQYLGDYRDAFKWDLLHWLCTETTPLFRQLLFIPLLTPDDAVPTDGQIHHRRFVAREFIHAFLEELHVDPRTLERVGRLGTQTGQRSFFVTVHGPDCHVGAGAERAEYWRGLEPESFESTVVFCDPDNGFETKTQRGPKWVRHHEISRLLNGLPQSSVVIVYQHRPRRRWKDVFADLSDECAKYAPFTCAAYDDSLALIVLAKHANAFTATRRALVSYATQHPSVDFADLHSLRTRP